MAADPQHQPQARLHRPLFRNVLECARIYQTNMMDLLAAEKGHTELRLSFQPVMFSVPPAGVRTTDLASQLGMSKQNCFQLIKQMEAIGYLQRGLDPDDKRARNIQLTPRGLELLQDGFEITIRANEHCAQILGTDGFRELQLAMNALCRALRLRSLARFEPPADIQHLPSTFGHDLIQLANHSNRQLLQSTMALGHAELRPAYGQVLLHIGSNGARIQDIARINDISKQAVGQLVAELETLGYIRRAADPEDGRSKILYFAKNGFALLEDTIVATEQLQEKYRCIIGDASYEGMEKQFASLYGGLKPNTDSHSANFSGNVQSSNGAGRGALSRASMLKYLEHRMATADTALESNSQNGEDTQQTSFDPISFETVLVENMAAGKIRLLHRLLDELASLSREPGQE